MSVELPAEDVESGAPTAVRLWVLIDRVARASGATVLEQVERVAGPGGHQITSLEEHEMLYRLAAASSAQVRIGQLESVVLRDKNKITRLVDRLEASGLVERTLCDTDRRVTLVHLTDTGRDMLTAIGPAWALGLRETLTHLTAEQTNRLADLLDVLLAGALHTLSTRFGTRSGNDADAFALPTLQRLVTSWREAATGVGPDHVVTWIRVLRLSAVLDDAFDRSLRERHDLSRPEAEMLLALHASPGRDLPLSTLARVAGVTSGGGTRIIDRLIRRGLVTRERHPSDRRSLLAHLTPAGDQLAAAATTTKSEIADTGIGPHLDAHDRNDLVHLLERLLDRSSALDEVAGGGSPDAAPAGGAQRAAIRAC